VNQSAVSREPLRVVIRQRWARASLQRNAIYMMLTQMVNAGLGGLYWLVAARLYVPHDIGLATALVSAMTLSSLIANIGAGTALIELLPGARGARDWSRILLAALAASGVAALALGGVIALLLPHLAAGFAHLTVPWVALVFVAGVLFWTLTTVLDLAFVAERKAGYSLRRNTLFSLGKMPLVFVPLLASSTSRGDVLYATWVATAAASFFLGLFVLLPRSGRRLRLELNGLWSQLRAMVHSFAGHHAINLAAAATIYTLPLLVTIRLSATANAYFYVTWMVSGIVLVVSPSVASALFAEGARAPDQLTHQVKTAARVILALVVPLGLLLAVFGEWLLGLFGNAYAAHGYILLLVIIAGTLPDAATTIVVAALRVKRRRREAAVLNTAIAIVTLGLAWVLLPTFGVVGAGIAWLAAQLAGAVAVTLIVLFRRSGSAYGGSGAQRT
jgi:O-antigen/teichoic acid export membrane protein